MFGLKPTPQSFWKWFVANEAMLFDFERDQERVFGKLASRMRRIEPNLTFEFGPKTSIGREFVISAGGIKSAFPAVLSLVAAAPRLERWQVTGFRPRRDPILTIELRGRKADSEQVEFSLIDNGTIIGIYLFIPGFDESDVTWKEIGYLLLDVALGEYDVETKVGPFSVSSPDSAQPGTRFPFKDLPEIFDRHCLTLQDRATGAVPVPKPN